MLITCKLVQSKELAQHTASKVHAVKGKQQIQQMNVTLQLWTCCMKKRTQTKHCL